MIQLFQDWWNFLFHTGEPMPIVIFFCVLSLALIILVLAVVWLLLTELYMFLDYVGVKPMSYSGIVKAYAHGTADFRRNADRAVFSVSLSATDYYDIDDLEEDEDITDEPVYVFNTKTGRFSKREKGHKFVKQLTKKPVTNN